MTTTIIGFPRIGQHRELKFKTEHYWKHEISQDELKQAAKDIRIKHWKAQQQAGIGLIPVGDFSFFDNLLDTAVALNIVSKRYHDLNLSSLDEYFAQARGYQNGDDSVKALPMKKWFNTNYHYIVPEFTPSTDIKLVGTKLFDELKEAQSLNINPKAVIIGPYTLLKLSRFIDEPALSFDVSPEEKQRFDQLYDGILASDHHVKVALQNYFGNIQDVYEDVINKPFDGIGLDFVEGQHNLDLINANGFPDDKVLFAGVVNGKNIWRNNYSKTLDLLKPIQDKVTNLILNTSCSLLHVPYTAADENKVDANIKTHLAFAIEKLHELVELDQVVSHTNDGERFLKANQNIFQTIRHPYNDDVHKRINSLTNDDYQRSPQRSEREKVQKAELKLPILPTTTIGSFPQTADVRANRRKLRHHEITNEEYDQFNRDKIKRIIKIQEEIGIDVLVHGEYERNDMVEYFGEKLDGFAFTQNGWVQSYGTRGVKPPIIWGDVSRTAPITVAASVYANQLTDHWIKGMITGPVTIFNWSFPREDISRKETVTQIALALRDEVLDLEKHDIKIIQIDEPALRENLPLRKTDWYSQYLDWAVPAFRLVHSGVQPTTQIHTHMCYSEFGDILPAIDNLDADVISFEASRADFTLIDQLVANHFQTEVGPGVYDIHSPRVPSTAEVKDLIEKIITKLPINKVWINPDCGLKTRSEKASIDSLKNIVQATHEVRKEVDVHEFN